MKTRSHPLPRVGFLLACDLQVALKDCTSGGEFISKKTCLVRAPRDTAYANSRAMSL